MVVHIIEDDPAVREALSLLMEAMGRVVRAYNDAESFFETALIAKDDTAFIDLNLPGRSGADVVKWLQHQQSLPRIVLFSGQSQKEITRQTVGLDNITVLRKPLDATSLFRHLG